MNNLGLKLAPDSGEDWIGVGGGGATPGEHDFCSREGALALKAKIEVYWRERGQHVMVALHNVGFHPAIRAARYDVRSDMVNGMPRTATAKPAPKQEAQAEAFAIEDDDLSFD